MDETDVDILWNDCVRDENVTSVRNMKALIVKMETVTVTDW